MSQVETPHGLPFAGFRGGAIGDRWSPLRGGGSCGELMRSIDWSRTPLGPVEQWSVPLRTTVSTLLHSRHPMFLWWGPELIQFYNDAYLPSFGVGKHPAAMAQRGAECWPEIWPIIHPQIVDVMERGIPSWHENQLVPIFRNGSIEDVYWTYSYSPVFGEDGRVAGTLVVCTETTRAVLSRAELENRNDFEQHLLGIASHDLRNPLTAIALTAAAITRREDFDERGTRSVLRIQAAAERALRMVKDLLDFTQARLGSGIPVSPRDVDLKALVQQVILEVEASFPDCRLRMESVGDALGSWDADRLAQVVTNLLSNAVKYGAPGADITVRILGAARDSVSLEVHNLGPPIPVDEKLRLFQPMQRMSTGPDASGRSVGLGLYIVKSIVEAHGGEVDVRSSEDEGTTFIVTLPRRTPGRSSSSAKGPPVLAE